MASTFSSDLKLELMATGENSGTWGTKTNTNLELVQQAIAGYQSINVASSDVALTMANASISNARNMILKFTGTLAANRTVTIPDSIEKFYIVVDGTTHSGNTLTFKTVSGTGFTCVQGKSHFCYSDGTNINLISGIQLANNTLDAVLDNGNTSDGTINVSNVTVTAATSVNTLAASGNITGGGTLTTVGNIQNTAGNIDANAGNVIDQKGEIRTVPRLDKSASYTLTLADHGKFIRTDSGIVVPHGVFGSSDAGKSISIYNNHSSSSISITRASGAVMYWTQTGADGNRTLNSRGLATILCVGTNTFVITGGTLT